MPTFDFQSPEGRKRSAGSQRDSGDWWKSDPVQHLTDAHSQRDSTGDRMPSPPPGFVLENQRQSMPSPPPGFELERPPAGSNWWGNDPIASAGQASDWDQFPLVRPAAAAKHEWWANDPVVHAPEAEQKEPEFGSEEYINAKAKKFNMHPDYVRGIVNSQTSSEAVKGFPVLGGFANRVAAGGAALVHPVTGAGSNEGSVSERSNKNMEFEKEIEADYEKSHPGTAALANTIGGLALTGGAGMSSLGAKALGLTGSLGEMTAKGALSGGAIGLADAAARGEDPLTGGGIGLATGLVAPGAGRVVSSVARPITSAVRGALDPAGEAARRVSGAIARDVKAGSAGLTEPEFLGAQSTGTPVNLMDVGGETTRALARSAANTSPEGRGLLNKSINDRFEAQANRFEDYLNSTFHYPDPIAQQEARHAAYRESTAPAYKKAYEEGDKEIWSPELERLTAAPMIQDALGSAMSKWKNYAVRDGYGAMNPPFRVDSGGLIKTGGGMKAYPNLQLWDYAARELQDAARNAPPGTQQAALSNDLARSLKNELDKQVPSYKDARETAFDYFQARDAMQAGANYATSRKVFSNNQTRLALAQMNDTQRKLFQDGFVGAYIDRIRNMPDRSNVAGKVMNSPNAREQMAIALGPQRAKELQNFTHVENVMDAARNAVQGNSTTARQLVELGLAGGFGGLETGNNPLTDPEAFMHSALVFGALRGHAKINERVARQVAKLLTSNDLSKVSTGIKILSQHPSLSNSVRHADAAIASVIARGSSPALEWRH